MTEHHLKTAECIITRYEDKIFVQFPHSDLDDMHFSGRYRIRARLYPDRADITIIQFDRRTGMPKGDLFVIWAKKLTMRAEGDQ